MPAKTKPRAFLRNGHVWLDDMPVTVVGVHGPASLGADKLLQLHVDDQRAYIARLQDRVEKVASYLAERRAAKWSREHTP